MTRTLVPYHLDERLADLDVVQAPDTTITAELPAGDPWKRMAVLYDWLASSVADTVRRGGHPVVISGDCTTSIGTVAGLQRAGLDPGIVWFDAHGDVQTLETTASGYLGGMPLRVLTGYRPELIAESLGLDPIPEERVLLVDARDLDPPEVDYLAGSAISRCAIEEVSADVLPEGPLYLHVDFDVVDPTELPGLRFPAPDGPGLDPVFDAIGRVIATRRVVAFGAACTWWPGQGADQQIRPLLEDAIDALS